MRRLAMTLLVVVSFGLLGLAAATHAAGMPGAPDDHASHAEHMAGCADHGTCSSDDTLCDFVCSGMASFVLSDGSADLTVTAVSHARRVAGPPAGIAPALNERPPKARLS